MKVPKYYRNEFESFFVNLYDLFFNVVTLFQIRRLRREAVNVLGLEKSQSVIDFACGTGEFTLIIADQVGNNGKVLGVDLSTRMLAIARKKLKAFSQVHFIRHNFEDIPFRRKYDAAVIGSGAHEVPPEARLNLYKQAYKMIKSGGKFMVFDYASAKYPLGWLLWVFLRIVEYPNGLLYIKEDHKKIIEGVGFTQILNKKSAGLFEVSIYKK
jgi:demethylmenaquinone methyltransferase/2-methoxy-6-polyprenyl-1,4-benzoquinol methylase